MIKNVENNTLLISCVRIDFLDVPLLGTPKTDN